MSIYEHLAFFNLQCLDIYGRGPELDGHYSWTGSPTILANASILLSDLDQRTTRCSRLLPTA
jgi:hypothetical protein